MQDLYLMACKKYIKYLDRRVYNNTWQENLQCIRSHLYDDDCGGRETINRRKNFKEHNESLKSYVNSDKEKLENLFPQEEYIYEILSHSAAICLHFLDIQNCIVSYEPKKIKGYFYSILPIDNPRLLGYNVELWKKANYAYETSTSYMKEFVDIDPNYSLEQLSEHVEMIHEILSELSIETANNLHYIS